MVATHPQIGHLGAFRERAAYVVDAHPVVVANPYTEWFARGAATLDDVRHLTVQFSVFSHLFLEAQLRKVINARSVESYRTAKQILMNELGVVFRSEREAVDVSPDLDPDLVGTHGTVEGSRFRFAAAHFEWLVRFATPLGLAFEDLGKRRHGTPSTLRFCDELVRWYGSDDASTAEGASYAVEHWAAAGFWKQLIAGLKGVQARTGLELPMAFWIWHDRVEDQHAAHTEDELAEAYRRDGFDEARFLAGASNVLDGVHTFWVGLDVDRRNGVTSS